LFCAAGPYTKNLEIFQKLYLAIFLNFAKIHLQTFLSVLVELLELVNLGAYGEIDEKVGTKLHEACKTAKKLNRTMDGQLENVYKLLNHFHITQKIPEWKKDIVNPVLGNLS